MSEFDVDGRMEQIRLSQDRAEQPYKDDDGNTLDEDGNIVEEYDEDADTGITPYDFGYWKRRAGLTV